MQIKSISKPIIIYLPIHYIPLTYSSPEVSTEPAEEWTCQYSGIDKGGLWHFISADLLGTGICGERGSHCFSCVFVDAFQAPMDSSNPMISQMASGTLNGSENRIKKSGMRRRDC